MNLSKIPVRRIGMSLCGVIICAVAVVFFKMAAFGVDPFQSLMSGLDRLIPISFGTLYVIVNSVLLIFSLVFNRHNIGIATISTCFCSGILPSSRWKRFRGGFRSPGPDSASFSLLSGLWSSASAARCT